MLTLRHTGYQGAGEQQLNAQGAVVQGDTKEAWLMTNNAVMLTPEEEPVITDPFAGATLRLPPVEGHLDVATRYTAATMALNEALNELLFDALQLGDADRERLGSRPFVVLKQMRYAGEPSDVAAGRLGAGAQRRRRCTRRTAPRWHTFTTSWASRCSGAGATPRRPYEHGCRMHHCQRRLRCASK